MSVFVRARLRKHSVFISFVSFGQSVRIKDVYLDTLE